MRSLIALVIGVALVWAGWWMVGSRAALRGAEAVLAALPSRGLQGGAEVTVAGFPNRFDLTFTDLHLADPQKGLAWQTPWAQVFAMGWKPWHLIGALPSGQRITTPYQDFTLDGEMIRASLQMRPAGDLALEQISGHVTAGQLASSQGWALGWQWAQASLARQDDDRKHLFAVKADAISLPVALPGLSAQVEGLEAVAILTFDADLDRYLTSAPAVVAVDLREARLIWGAVKLFGKGTVAADAAGLAEGEVALRVEGWRPAWEALRAAANLPPLVQSGIAAMLENLSRQSANPEVLDLDLVMEGGMMRLGPMPLGPAPRLR